MTLVRALWLRYRLRNGAVVLHASAFFTNTSVVLALGEPYSGKSSLMLDAVFRHGWHFLADDRLLLWCSSQGRLLACPLPSVVRVRAPTARRLRAWLTSTEKNRLPLQETDCDHPSITSEVAYWPPATMGARRLPVVDMDSVEVTVLHAHFDSRLDHEIPQRVSRVHAQRIERKTGQHLLRSRARLNRYPALTAEDLPGLAELDQTHMRDSAKALTAHLSRLAVFGNYTHQGAFDPACVRFLRAHSRTPPRIEAPQS